MVTPAATLRERLSQSPATIPIAYIFAGVLVGIGMLALDATLGESATAEWLWVGAQTARASLVGLATSFLFVISVVFWVRIWAVQVTAGSLLPRVLSRFLTDRVQQHAMGFLIAGIAYALTVVRAVPEEASGGATVPHLSVTLAYVDALVVAVVIVLVIHDAARSSQIGRLVHQITDASVELIRTTHPPLGEGEDGDGPPPVERPSTSGQAFRAYRSGWVRDIDEGRLLAACPPSSVVEVSVRIGSFVLEGQRLATAWAPGEPPATDTVRRAFRLADEPSERDSLAYGINELVDIARRATSAGSSDSTTAREAVLHLAVVVRELLLHDLPRTHRLDDRDRQLLRRQDLTLSDYCEASFGRIRDVASDSHELLTIMLAVIEEISGQLAEQGLWDRRDLLREQARRALDQARDHLTLPQSIERAASVARAAGVHTDQTA